MRFFHRNALIVVILCTVAFVGFFALRPESPTVQPVSDFSRAVEGWSEVIRKSGPTRAYARLEEEVVHRTLDAQHAEAHHFGAALYAVEGVEGLSTCDAQFSYGCFHEFLGQAIQDLGLTAVGELNERCFEALGPQWLSCQHGIGHGVAAFLGYDDTALRDALDVCADIPKNDPIGGCYGGVFMEYNLRTMLGSDAVIRQPNSQNLIEPCDTLESRYQHACYYWQPQWWSAVLGDGPGTTVVFSRMGSLCDAAPDRSTRRSCFEGIGNITAHEAAYIPERIIELCEATSADDKDRLFCRSTASNSLSMTMPDRAEEVCARLSGERLLFCQKYARNEGNSLIVVQEPE